MKEFKNWRIPPEKDLETEYDVEYQYHVMDKYGNLFPTKKDFMQAVKESEKRIITEKENDEMLNRTHCPTIKCIQDISRTYRSYPMYRNNDTINAIVQGFSKDSKDQPMSMPIVLQCNNKGKLYDKKQEVMSGNTRLNIAEIMGIKPKVSILKVDCKNRF